VAPIVDRDSELQDEGLTTLDARMMQPRLRDDPLPGTPLNLQGLGTPMSKTLPDVDQMQQERANLDRLHRLSLRCEQAPSLSELESLLVEALERAAPVDRGFISYRLASGDWKLVMVAQVWAWPREIVRDLLQRALKSRKPVHVRSALADPGLGTRPDGRDDSRLLLPLHFHDRAVGAIFLASLDPDGFDEGVRTYLVPLADLVASALSAPGR
jgi:uncharacterized protein YigA (DUF484 family)